ncbi:MAG TPA: hypothetical protein VN253_20220 [Kofleriaceae bacterium]|nr:hypothetical protein [Kofleriaceae bacterium]
MLAASLSTLLVLVVTLAGCPGDGASVGETCDRHSDCGAALQCAQHTCVPRCERAPDCGDGYACDENGICHHAQGQAGDACRSEVECAPGLSCQIDGTRVEDGRLRASCTAQHAGAPAGASCLSDEDCRNGTCALGRCIDLCASTRDCGAGMSCMTIPRVEADGALFDGCLLSKGVVSWKIPLRSPKDEILFPVPGGAHYAQLVFSAPAPQRVGAESLYAPTGRLLYRPCQELPPYNCPSNHCPPYNCLEDKEADQYYQNPVRHRREIGTAVLAMPPSPETSLETGAYRVKAMAPQPDGRIGATPSVTAVVRIGPAVILDLHFYFLDLADHPCEAAFGNVKLDAAAARTEGFFQTDFIGPPLPAGVQDSGQLPVTLRSIFSNGGIALGEISYEDIANHHELDGLDTSNAGALLRLGRYGQGVNVFFVRTLSPVGLQTFSPNPGPAGLGGTLRSGIVIGIDTLCYRSWEQLARLTAHEIARYMGLYHNVELGATPDDPRRDPIDDSNDSPDNLMFYSELGGTVLSHGQRDILMRSPVLR